MHAGNSIVLMDFGKSDAQHIIDLSKTLPCDDHQEISAYMARLLEKNQNGSTIKCIFEESQIDALLSMLHRFSNRDDLVNRVQNSAQ